MGLSGTAEYDKLKRAGSLLESLRSVAGAAQVQGTVFADRGVRSLTALRSLRCLALEVYQNVAMDGLVCLSVITQVTQLQARALTVSNPHTVAHMVRLPCLTAGHSAASQSLTACIIWINPVLLSVACAVHAAVAGPAAANELLHSLDNLHHIASFRAQVQCTQLKLDLLAAISRLPRLADLNLAQFDQTASQRGQSGLSWTMLNLLATMHNLTALDLSYVAISEDQVPARPSL